MPDLVFLGTAMVLIGFLVVFLAMVLSGKSSDEGEGQTRVRGGGVIMVGPIPIIFGSDARWASVAVVLAIVLIVVVLLTGIGPLYLVEEVVGVLPSVV
jgi:uncharacterized protein (TIGR00304 family)